MRDDNWKERIKAALENRTPNILRATIEPYFIAVKPFPVGTRQAIEVRPRAGYWAPFFFAIPMEEKDRVKASIGRGPRDNYPVSGMYSGGETPTDDGKWHIIFRNEEATPSISYYLSCESIPSQIGFGVFKGQPQFLVNLTE
jgi:hypothetical protein